MLLIDLDQGRCCEGRALSDSERGIQVRRENPGRGTATVRVGLDRKPQDFARERRYSGISLRHLPWAVALAGIGSALLIQILDPLRILWRWCHGDRPYSGNIQPSLQKTSLL